MTAKQIIDQIAALPREEQAEIIRYAYRLDAERQLSGAELSALAERMASASDPAEIAALRSQIAQGFFGPEPHA